MPKAGHGLKLNLPGAPLEPHLVMTALGVPVPGHYAPHVPTPVGGEQEMSIEAARAYAKDPAVHLELVDIAAADIDGVREFWAEFRSKAHTATARAAKVLDPAEQVRVADEAAALAPPDTTDPKEV